MGRMITREEANRIVREAFAPMAEALKEIKATCPECHAEFVEGLERLRPEYPEFVSAILEPDQEKPNAHRH